VPDVFWHQPTWSPDDRLHLLAWYNGTIGKMSNTACLYRYGLGSKMLARVLPQSALGIVTLFSACAAVAHGCS